MDHVARVLECDPKTVRKYVRLSQVLPVKTIQKWETLTNQEIRDEMQQQRIAEVEELQERMMYQEPDTFVSP